MDNLAGSIIKPHQSQPLSQKCVKKNWESTETREPLLSVVNHIDDLYFKPQGVCSICLERQNGQRITIVSERGGVRLLSVTSLKKLPVPRAVVVRLRFDHQKEC
jgi:hypothetical protein